MAYGSGHGGMIRFGTNTTFIPDVISIDGAEKTRPRMDTSHLGTTGVRTQIPGDLAEVGTFTVTCLFNPNDDALVNVPFGAAETITITFGETVPASASGAKYIGSGFIVGRTFPGMQTDNVMTYSFDVSWATEPAFTEEA